MAYWGEAMTHTHPVWDQQDVEAGRAALARLGPTPAARAAKAPTAREKAYLAALEILYGTGPKARRDTLYSEAMARLAHTYLGDDQAHLFYALSLLGLSQGVRNMPTYLRAATIAESALAREPRNPGAAHYLIHAVDDPDHAARGLPAAVCGHYPSWLEYGYLEQGRIQKARVALRACYERTRTAHRGAGDADPDNSTIGSYAMMRARFLIDLGGADDPAAAWTVDPGADTHAALTDAFVHGLDASRRGDAAGLEAARTACDSLADILRAGMEARGAADPGSTELGKRVRVLALELEGLAGRAAGDEGAALATLERAAAVEDSMAFAFGPPFVDQPAHELLGQALLAGRDPGRAAEEFRRALARAPRRTPSLLGLARAAAAAGDSAAATATYRELVAIWHGADADLPGLAEARRLGGSAAASPPAGRATPRTSPR